jgi:hypothetical protein
MHFQFRHQLTNYLIRHNFDELDLYFASHPAEMYEFLRVKAICGIEKSESIFYEKIVGYDKKRRRAFICINMLMLENETNLHRVIREGIQEADTIVTISREDSVAESFILASQYCEKIGIKVAFGNQS